MDRAILSVLNTDGPLHVTEIATRIDAHPITVDQICTRLYNDGYISPTGGGRYRLTDTGNKHLSDNYGQRRESEEPL